MGAAVGNDRVHSQLHGRAPLQQRVVAVAVEAVATPPVAAQAAAHKAGVVVRVREVHLADRQLEVAWAERLPVRFQVR